ncbi:chemotaxis protein MotB [Salinibacter ruber]|nr:OmpA family protein [Salinibacter ruber]MBB4061764.1 chemotaxis protein MotB [Salinibacter ruber]MBB4068389.1 chemotaxis protein MotB [Salinibacter ruber]MCS3629115.1 chemotaxis protein MotB [Salinibacter ruber]MCS3638671.1 chemotaxis protein MotB [Salinibacter ruber]MCS3661623.1 chemotaxis protein MotB [Salinibacter ruber]
MSSDEVGPNTDEDDGDDMPTAPFWMTTYGDIMTLLVTFFVLLISMSEIRMKKFRDAISNFQRQPGMFSGSKSVVPADYSSGSSQSRARKRAEQYEQFLKRLEERGLGEKIQADLKKEGIHVVIADSLMFRTGRARLLKPSRTVLRELANLLSRDVGSVVVSGHTDDRPIGTRKFPSNWELSTARAASAVRFLQERAPEYDSSRFQAVGHASTDPRASNQTDEGRAKNRRVEIMFNWRSWNSNKTTSTRPTPESTATGP